MADSYRATLLQRWDMHSDYKTMSLYGKGVDFFQWYGQAEKLYSPVSGFNMLTNAQKTNWEGFNSAIRDNPEDIAVRQL